MPDFTGSSIDHLNIAVPDLARSLAFYEPTLASLGIVKVMTVPADEATGQLEMHGFGWEHKPFFWLVAGGRTLLEPGLRPEYQPDYYGAFVLDPDGINVEAVCHRPE